MDWTHSVPVAKLGLDVPCIGPMNKEPNQGCKKKASNAWEEDSSSVDPAVQDKVDGGLHAAHTLSQGPAASLSAGLYWYPEWEVGHQLSLSLLPLPSYASLALQEQA